MCCSSTHIILTPLLPLSYFRQMQRAGAYDDGAGWLAHRAVQVMTFLVGGGWLMRLDRLSLHKKRVVLTGRYDDEGGGNVFSSIDLSLVRYPLVHTFHNSYTLSQRHWHWSFHDITPRRRFPDALIAAEEDDLGSGRHYEDGECTLEYRFIAGAGTGVIDFMTRRQAGKAVRIVTTLRT
ncbi:hypothetical protein Hypma_014572 [Hypsizygus marmoreus]|uniref:Uncharacterized protein n=1 Tax=Hypsizygus marmoreus TaxID=39966 RepID=A0A369J9V2_HYPMA|nr:hypothetical protein Hypma_014572 [Hypsizygus marmoreus]